MGDSYLQNNGTNVRLRLEHSLDQEEYLIWKFNSLKRIFNPFPIVKLNRTHPVTKKEYKYIRCQSRTLPELRTIKEVFYKDGKKIVPADLKNYITRPISLAVWFMDDGYYYKRDKCGYLYLGNVVKQEALICREALKDNFGLETKVLSKKKGYALYFSRLEMLKLKKIIGRYIIPLFKYKIPIDPVTTDPSKPYVEKER